MRTSWRTWGSERTLHLPAGAMPLHPLQRSRGKTLIKMSSLPRGEPETLDEMSLSTPSLTRSHEG